MVLLKNWNLQVVRLKKKGTYNTYFQLILNMRLLSSTLCTHEIIKFGISLI